jgi:hypothetical protein
MELGNGSDRDRSPLVNAARPVTSYTAMSWRDNFPSSIPGATTHGRSTGASLEGLSNRHVLPRAVL